MLSAYDAVRVPQRELIFRIPADQDDIFFHIRDVLPTWWCLFPDF
jgi:hypothetical protein